MSTSDKLKIFFPLQLWENNSILRKKSQKIEKITPEIREFWEILLELMREYDGVGLAAPQIWENIAMIATTQWKKVPQGKNADKDYLGETWNCRQIKGNANFWRSLSFSSMKKRKCEEAWTSYCKIPRPQGKNKKTEIFWIQRLYHTTWNRSPWVSSFYR